MSKGMRFILAYCLASYPVMVTLVLFLLADGAFASGWRGVGDIATAVGMVVFAPFAAFFLLILYGLPNLIFLLRDHPAGVLENPGFPLIYVLLGVAWVAAYQAMPRLARWWHARSA